MMTTRLLSIAVLAALAIALPLAAAVPNPLLRGSAAAVQEAVPLLNALPIDIAAVDEAAAAALPNAAVEPDTQATAATAAAALPSKLADAVAPLDKPAFAILLAGANTNTATSATAAASTSSTDPDIDPEAIRNLKPFPPADPGMKRFVLFMPRSNTSSDLMVEIQVGQTLLLEPRNLYSYASALQTKTLKGWGFTYYSLPAWGPMVSTRIAVDPQQPKVQRWVQVRASPLMRYNPRLPIVVYAPADAEVRSRYWRADAQATSLPEA